MPNPSTIAEQEQAEIADLRKRNNELVIEISQLLHIIKEKNAEISRLRTAMNRWSEEETLFGRRLR